MGMFSWPFGRNRPLSYQQGLALGRREALEEHLHRREAFDRLEKQQRVGSPLLVIPNEWDNPIVGFGHSVQDLGHSCLLIVTNYLTMEEVWCGGVVMGFSNQRLEAALALDPFQLWALCAHHAVGHEDVDKPKTGERWDRARILDTLERNGFFERWQAFQAAQAGSAS